MPNLASIYLFFPYISGIAWSRNCILSGSFQPPFAQAIHSFVKSFYRRVEGIKPQPPAQQTSALSITRGNLKWKSRAVSNSQYSRRPCRGCFDLCFGCQHSYLEPERVRLHGFAYRPKLTGPTLTKNTSFVLQRDADQTLLDLFPFAVDATLFRENFQSRVAIVKSELCKYLVSKAPPPLNRNEKGEKLSPDEAEEKVERVLQDLFWRLVSLRAQPHNMRMSVLVRF